MLTMLLALSLIHKAHSWYPSDCCNEKDCRPIAADQVRETPSGYQLWDGREIPYPKARQSPDGEFHLCESLQGAILCFYSNKGGF
jgi:hypothetical protein